MRRVLVLMLAACGGVSEEDFAQARQDAYCDRLFACVSTTVGAATQAECYNDVPGPGSTSTSTGCTFDRRAAVDCIAAIEHADCQEVLDPYFLPEECNGVCL